MDSFVCYSFTSVETICEFKSYKQVYFSVIKVTLESQMFIS